ncbi:MAG: hypothetical protein RLZZ135_808 [Cyanobacteriota bacterium]
MKAVFFDLDGTLLDRNASVERFISAQYNRLSDRFSHILKNDYIARFIELDCHGHVWKDKVYQALVTEFVIEGISWQALLVDYEMRFQFYCLPFQFLVEMLDDLKDKDYLLGIITNGRGQFQSRAIEGLRIRHYFDTILISEVEQLRKPQVEIFQRAMNRLAVSALDSVFVGDHPEADIAGAKSAMMQTIWKRNSFWAEATEADAIIDELREISPILAQFNN